MLAASGRARRGSGGRALETQRWSAQSSEVCRTAPTVAPSMRIALEALRLKRLDAVHPGDRSVMLGRGIRALALGRLLEDLEPVS